MRTFLIAYDLSNPSAARHRLSGEIMQLGEAWARPLESTWYVRASLRKAAVETALRAHLDEEDGLIIQEVAAEAALLNTSLRWFKRRSEAAPAASDNVVAFPAPAADPAMPQAEAA
ncbi:MAG: hypothetical protein AB7K67_11035 [Hyphomicrobiaceae bacterium]